MGLEGNQLTIIPQSLVQVFQGYLYNTIDNTGYNANLGVMAEMVFCCQFQKLECNGVEMRIFYH